MSNQEQQIEQEIQSKNLNAPRLTPADIDATIVDEYYFTAAQGVGNNCNGYDALGFHDSLKTLTFCVLILKNGFKVTGQSDCASPENFDAEIGKKIAYQNAREKIWLLEGYLLKDKLHIGKLCSDERPCINCFADSGECLGPYKAAPKTHIERMTEEKAALDEKLNALKAFLAKIGTDEAPLLTDDQVYSLESQAEVMGLYSNILGSRIEYDADLFKAMGG